MLNIDIKINNNENNLFASKNSYKEQNQDNNFSKVFEDTTKSYEKSMEQSKTDKQDINKPEKENETQKVENNNIIQQIQELLLISQQQNIQNNTETLKEQTANEINLNNEEVKKPLDEIQFLNKLINNVKNNSKNILPEDTKAIKNSIALREQSERILHQKEQTLELTAKMMNELKAVEQKLVTSKNIEQTTPKLFTQESLFNLDNLSNINMSSQPQAALSDIADDLKVEISEIKISSADEKSGTKNFDFNNSNFSNLNSHITKLSLNKNVNFAKTLNNVQTQEQSVLNQVKDATLKNLPKTGTSSINIILKPESIGKVNVNLISNNGVVSAQFTAESRQAADILNKNIDILKQNLSEQGVKIAEISVKVHETASSEAFSDNKNFDDNSFDNLKENLSQRNSNKADFQNKNQNASHDNMNETNEYIKSNEVQEEITNGIYDEKANKELEIYNNMGRKV